MYSPKDKKYLRCLGIAKDQEFQCDEIDEKKIPTTVTPATAPTTAPTSSWWTVKATPTSTLSTVTKAPIATSATVTKAPVATWSKATKSSVATWSTVSSDLHSTVVADPTVTETPTKTLEEHATLVCTILPEKSNVEGWSGYPQHRYDSCGGTQVEK